MSNHGDLRVERLTTLEQLEPLRERWNALATGVPFRSFEWLEGWCRSYGMFGATELFVLVARNSTGQVLGIAPWFVERVAGARVVRFLGSGEVCSDYLTILAQTGQEKSVAHSIAEWMQAAQDQRQPLWHQIELGSVYEDDKTMAPLIERLTSYDNWLHSRARSSCWRVHLPANWENYLGMLSKSHRKQLRRLDREYLQNGRAQCRIASTVADLDRGLDMLTRLHERRRASLGERGSFGSPRFATFRNLVAHRLLACGQLRLSLLDVDGQTVAAEYQVLGQDVVYAYQSGIEPDALRHQPGQLITLLTIQQAIAEGRAAFDFLRGDEAYKAHWRAVARPTHDLRLIGNTPRARLRHQLWLASTGVKAWVLGFSARAAGLGWL